MTCKVLGYLVKHAGLVFPLVMIATIAIYSYVAWIRGADTEKGLFPFILYGTGAIGVAMKLLAVIVRGLEQRGGLVTYLNLAFTYERFALMVVILSIISLRISRIYPSAPVVPDWVTYGLLGASMTMLFIVGFSELYGGGRRHWLRYRINPWPLPRRWISQDPNGRHERADFHDGYDPEGDAYAPGETERED